MINETLGNILMVVITACYGGYFGRKFVDWFIKERNRIRKENL